MKQNKKVIFGIVAGFFAVATVFNMSMLNENGAGDVSLDAVAVMAEAENETVPGWTNDWDNPHNTCNIPGGMCDVSAQLP